MTEKLFEADSYISEFDCEVISFGEDKNRIYIETDKTAFFPEGGGQTSDKGYLDGLYISDVQLIDGRIFHYTENTPEALDLLKSKNKLHGKIDMQKRFSDMQQHSGEHIVSGIVCSSFGYNNVGFHLGTEIVTLDFDGALTREDIDRVELLANKAIWDNKEILVHFPTDEELKNISYRSKIEIEGQTRLVEIPGIDMCACCAPHVKMTGEIGVIEIVAFEKYKGGTRVSILCGERALRDMRHKLEENRKVSQAFSAKMPETGNAALRMNEALSNEKFRAAGLEKRLFAFLAEQYRGKGDVAHLEENLTPAGVRELADAIAAVCGGRAAVISGVDGNFSVCLIHQGGDVKEFANAMKAALNGRGGGKPGTFQGSLNASKAQIKEFFKF